jgi:hypothetical protein
MTNYLDYDSLESVCDMCNSIRNCVAYMGYTLHGETSICEECINELVLKKKIDDKIKLHLSNNVRDCVNFMYCDSYVKTRINYTIHQAESNRIQLISEITNHTKCLKDIKQQLKIFINDYTYGKIKNVNVCNIHTCCIESEKDYTCKMLMIACASPYCFCAYKNQSKLADLASELGD